jgi:hypothetical protein
MTLLAYFENPKSYWLRWIGILPCSILGMLLMGVITRLFFNLPSLIFNFTEFYTTYIIALFAGIVSGGTAINIAYLIAPLHKKRTALIIFWIISIVTIGVAIFSYNEGKYGLVVEEIMIVVGGFYSLKNVNTQSNI